MTDRVRALAPKIDRALDASPVGGSLPALVELTNDPDRVLTLSDVAAAESVGARVSFGTDTSPRYDILADIGALAAKGEFEVPIARTFTLERSETSASESAMIGDHVVGDTQQPRQGGVALGAVAAPGVERTNEHLGRRRPRVCPGCRNHAVAGGSFDSLSAK